MSEIDDITLVYLRGSPDDNLAAEICVKDGVNYTVVGMSERALYNLAKEAVHLLGQRKFFNKGK